MLACLLTPPQFVMAFYLNHKKCAGWLHQQSPGWKLVSTGLWLLRTVKALRDLQREMSAREVSVGQLEESAKGRLEVNEGLIRWYVCNMIVRVWWCEYEFVCDICVGHVCDVWYVCYAHMWQVSGTGSDLGKQNPTQGKKERGKEIRLIISSHPKLHISAYILRLDTRSYITVDKVLHNPQQGNSVLLQSRSGCII